MGEEWHRSDGRYKGNGENHQRQLEATRKALGAVLGAFEERHNNYPANVSDMFRISSTNLPNYLINMASPRGFEPLLPP